MKITDLSLIYIAVLLPIIIVVYVNVSFTIKAQEQEIYYQNLIDVAVQDATDQMKNVENKDTKVDYGYSGSLNEKVSSNVQIGIDTFFNNLYNNFGIKGNEASEHLTQLYVPAIALIDYDGIVVSSVESYSLDSLDGEKRIEHKLKPKNHYVYTYTLKNDGSLVEGYYSGSNAKSWHLIEFTMDDKIVHRGCEKDNTGTIKDYETKSFYLDDGENNEVLGDEGIKRLEEIRKDVIVNTVVKELTYAVNKNNSYSRSAGITYTFAFPTTSTEDMYAKVSNVGLMAFVQGLNVGNKYLNTKAYSLTSLELVNRYYFSVHDTDYLSVKSKYIYNLYHRDNTCPEYLASKKMYNSNVTFEKLSPRYVLSKQEAASSSVQVKWKVKDDTGKETEVEKTYQGFYPCPICNP